MNKSGKQRQIILDAAYQCIANRGYANSSMREIAREADVTLSQLHYYFGSKKDLFKDVITIMKDKYVDELKSAQRKAKEENKNSLESILEFEKTLLQNNSELLQILLDLVSMSLRYEEFKVLMSSLFEELADLISDSLEGTKLRIKAFEKADNSDLSKLLLGSLIGVALQDIFSASESDGFGLMKMLLPEFS